MKKVETHRRRVATAAACAIVAICVIGAWRYASRSHAGYGARADSVGASPASVSASSGVSGLAAAAASSVGSAERSLDVAALREALAGRPDAQAEVQRIVAFARFRDRVAAFGSGREGMSAAERARLAREILAELPEHVARHEIVPVQAQAMTAALLSDAEADPGVRAAQLEASRRQWDAYSRQTVGPSPAEDPRFQTYARQSRDIVQEVQSSVPDPQQQQIVIAQRLKALRVQLFDQAPLPGTH